MSWLRPPTQRVTTLLLAFIIQAHKQLRDGGSATIFATRRLTRRSATVARVVGGTFYEGKAAVSESRAVSAASAHFVAGLVRRSGDAACYLLHLRT